MQFQVPQFIDTEDKIVGPLTLKQFGFVAAGAILSAILYFTVVPWLWVICSMIIFAAAIALAFVKIEGRPFASVLVSAFNFYWRPQTYIWQPEKPTMHVSSHETKAASGAGGGSVLEDLLAKSAAKIVYAPTRAAQVFSPKPKAVEATKEPVMPKAEPAKEPQPTKELAAAQSPAPESERPHVVTRPEPEPVQQPAPKLQPQPAFQSPLISRATASIGSALHKSWEDLQTGAPFAKKTSDKQFLDKKMAERYQIFQRVAGDRHAAKRVDYR